MLIFLRPELLPLLSLPILLGFTNSRVLTNHNPRGSKPSSRNLPRRNFATANPDFHSAQPLLLATSVRAYHSRRHTNSQQLPCGGALRAWNCIRGDRAVVGQFPITALPGLRSATWQTLPPKVISKQSVRTGSSMSDLAMWRTPT